MTPTLGGLVIERAINALEPASDRRTGGLVRKNVQPVGQNRVGGQLGDVIDAQAVVLRRERPEGPVRSGVDDNP